MKLTNLQIYQYTSEASKNLQNMDIYIPAKANFFLQKNINILAAAAEEIEKSRIEIAKHYGELDEENSQYKISQEKIEEASKELDDLFAIEQELDIKTLKIDDFGSAEFTPAQMQAMLFMIEE